MSEDKIILNHKKSFSYGDIDPHQRMSQDSEFDDGLGVPDSLEMASLDEPNETVNSNNKISDDKLTIVKTIPFSAIYSPPIKGTGRSYNIFIPGEAIHVKIIDNERNITTHPLNPNLYTIELQHGPFVWTIKKRYKHIQNLHNQLKIFRASLNIPFPTKSHRERRNSLRSLDENKIKRKSRCALPRFPNKPDCLVFYENFNHRIKTLEEYLRNLLQIEIYKRHPETIQFLEVSRLSFIKDLGDKGKESAVLKRTGSSANAGCMLCGLGGLTCGYMCTSLCGTWHVRHLVVKETFILYMTPKDGEIQSVILMDNSFEVSSGMYVTGLRHGLQIMNSSRHIVVKCWTRRKAREWLSFIQDTANSHGKYFIQVNPHRSFAPYRTPTPASWFVDGSSYMSAIADALENAKEEIFIADWWLSPEIYMKRPIIHGNYWRLDKILQRKALSGVKVFVMIYKEVELALGINSYYSKQKLVSACPENIKVFRHPDHARVGIFLWAHHEKIVVVDQTVAFVGGIDLCYGRWDTEEHRLTDLGSTHQSSIYIPTKGKITNTSSKRIVAVRTDKHVILPLAIATNTILMATTGCLPVIPMPGKCISSSSQPDFSSSTLLIPSKETQVFKCNTPDSQKKNLINMARTTVDRVKQNVKIKRQELINMVYNPNEMDNSSDSEDEIDNVVIREPVDVEGVLKNNADILSGLPGAAKLWLGKDYMNLIVKDFYDLERPYHDLVDRSTTPRMPWHDIGVMVQGAAARDIARHFIQRWNAIKMEKAKLNKAYPFLLPKSYRDCSSNTPFISSKLIHNVKCQVLRSVSSWSAGFLESDAVEESIHEAYIEAITNSEKFIYIENQFFITLATMERSTVKNRIGETLLKRILRAHREGSVFRVYVIMPLLPGFEGEVGGSSGTALHAITHWNYQSISRGRCSILNRLIESGVENPSEYITFHGLRTHSILNGTMVTELIYVHSKLMIVDDKIVICGSANINDRSMIATRDSEIAVIIHDEEFEEGKMNSTPYPCGKFVGSLRKQLFREHLGLLCYPRTINIDDVIDKSFYYELWKARSKDNTEIFEKVFKCIPSDEATDFITLKNYQNSIPLSISDPIIAQEMLTNVKGHLVDLPLEFLRDEVLTPGVNTVEGMMPTSLWT
ncbi:phospholipase D1 [Chelonus insularis]|uniref:phospholipase D1 n=1 Tax=Chelonus insularis TaxID=460826 RepID=UPI00158A6058|nr:phospholipase D1 [Chelonus insularis]